MVRQFVVAASLVLACACVGTSAPVPRASAPDPLGTACLGCEFETGGGRVPGQAPAPPDGLPITSVYDGSAAQRAGLLPNDVMLKFGDTPTAIFYDLKRALGMYRPGATVPVTIDRDGKTMVIRVRLSDTMGTRPETLVIVEP